jgi:hypothetical protein
LKCQIRGCLWPIWTSCPLCRNDKNFSESPACVESNSPVDKNSDLTPPKRMIPMVRRRDVECVRCRTKKISGDPAETKVTSGAPERRRRARHGRGHGAATNVPEEASLEGRLQSGWPQPRCLCQGGRRDQSALGGCRSQRRKNF